MPYERPSSLSVIVEWENTINVAESRPRKMLRELARQVKQEIHEYHTPIQLLLMYNPCDGDKQSILSILNDEWGSLLDDVNYELVEANRASYYELKNVGANHASGEIIVFVDSDVLPESCWLHNMVSSFADPAIGVCQGATYVQPESLFNKAIALAWVFPFKKRSGALTDENGTFANNIAYRKSVFLDNKYPNEITWRGQCSTQRAALKEKKIGVFWNNAARTIHPFPENLKHTIARSFYIGHDHVTRGAQSTVNKNSLKDSYWRWHTFLKRARRRKEQFSDDLQLTFIEEQYCSLIALGFWSCVLFSEIMTLKFSNYWRSRLTDLPQHHQSG